MFAYLKFRFQRQMRRFRRDFVRSSILTREYLDRHVYGKWRQLLIIKRLAAVWWALILVVVIGTSLQVDALSGYYLAKGPAMGGEYIEGEVGTVHNINPILPESTAASDVSRLVYSGLTRYDDQRHLEGDLAQNWDVSADHRTYTFHLRRGIKWHDGVPFTARDVLFTLTAIQNPDTRSPLAASWQGVKASAKDDYTVVFTLPTPYTPFLESTIVGILPSHILETTDPASLRVAAFNQHPVGTGPFKLRTFLTNEGIIELDANADYYGGRPLLDNFTFKLFTSTDKLTEAYANRQVTAIARLKPADIAKAPKLARMQLHTLSLPDETDVFLKTTSPALKEVAVRQALAQATDRGAIIQSQLMGNAESATLPILAGMLGYDGKLQPAGYDLAAAKSALDAAGWKAGRDGIRAKAGQPLKLRLVTLSSGDYPVVAAALKDQWAKAGVQLDVNEVDLVELQQSYIRPRNYDVLLYGLNLGADPDVYSFWHSSQVSDPGLNLSQYSSAEADKALEGGRLAADDKVRSAKYHTFLSAWKTDVPAIVLYEPDYIYATSPGVLGITADKLVDPADRFYDVQKWAVNSVDIQRQR